MKKSIMLGIISILIISGLGASALTETEQKTKEKFETISFSTPQIKDNSDYVEVTLNEATSYSMNAGEYILPAVTRVFRFPFGTKIKDVNVNFFDITEKTISKKIRLASEPIPDTYYKMMSSNVIEIDDVKFPIGVFPEKQYSYNIGAGRFGDSLVTILSVKLYPVQYDSSENTLYCADNAEIKISYDLPNNPFILLDEYDMVIITHSKFSSVLQPLVEHKNTHGVITKLITRDEICNSEYFPAEGRDCAEELKYFIKNAFDDWGIKYVLLVGGRSGGVMEEEWWVPVRYSYLDDGGEGSYLTDLYFADIYDGGGNFSSWDSNENDIFAEWNGPNKDILDMYPEVFVGRLACRNKLEVRTMVNKIITYENTAYGTDWFKKFVGVAGDTYPSVGDPYFEGELATEAGFNYLDGMGEGFESSYIWTSLGTFTGSQDVIDEVSKGCGFLHFSGHGNPSAWSNHPPNDEETWIDGPNSFDMSKFKNGDEQPIVIVGGCHNAQFNVNLLNILKGLIEEGFGYFSTDVPFGSFWYKEWVPRCWSWAMTNKQDGGCIAIIANTGLGYGLPGEDWNTGRGRFMEMQFFRSYSGGNDILGETHSTELAYYLDEFPPMDNQIDCKIVQQWALLGDPSLMIGGYSS